MIDTAAARRLMVEGQVRTADVSNAALLDAMMTIPRERFLSPAQAPLAYADIDVPLGSGRAMLKPMVLAKLIQAAGVRRRTDRLRLRRPRGGVVTQRSANSVYPVLFCSVWSSIVQI